MTRLSLASGHAASEEDAEQVVGEVAEPAARALDLLDQQVRCFDRTVARSGGVARQDLGPPTAQPLDRAAQFGPGLCGVAPGDGVVEPVGGEVGILGQIDVADLLLRVADLGIRWPLDA